MGAFMLGSQEQKVHPVYQIHAKYTRITRHVKKYTLFSGYMLSTPCIYWVHVDVYLYDKGTLGAYIMLGTQE